ncbi:hypothetical protein [Ancylobacter moscoviensis]
MHRKHLIEAGGFILTGVVFGTGLGLSLPPFLMRTWDPSWISFAGSVLGGVIGGVMTVGAGYLAWRGVAEQNELTRSLQRAQATEMQIHKLIAADSCRINIATAINFLYTVIRRPDDGKTIKAYYFQIIQAQYAARAAIDIGHYTLRYLLRDEIAEVRAEVGKVPAFEHLVNLADVSDLEASVAALQASLKRLDQALASVMEDHSATPPPAAKSGPKS